MKRNLALLVAMAATVVACGRPAAVRTDAERSTTSAARTDSSVAGPGSTRPQPPPASPTPEDKAKQESCPSCHVLSPAELAEEDEAARLALPDTIVPRTASTTDPQQARLYAKTGATLSGRLRKAFTFTGNGTNGGAAAVQKQEASIVAEVDDIYSTRISKYQRRNLAESAARHARSDSGGEAAPGYTLLQSVDVVLDGEPYAFEVGDVVTVVSEAHVVSKAVGGKAEMTYQQGVWQWTLVREQGRLTLLKEVSPVSS
jgi:hypothetical protein